MNILITGNVKLFEEQEIDLLKRNCNITYISREDENNEIDETIYDMVVCNWYFVHHDISKFTNLKKIQLLSSGMERIPMDYIEKNGIAVKNANNIYSIPIAEFIVMEVLDYYKHSYMFYNNEKERKWFKLRDLEELSNKTMGIVGCGGIGSEIAKRMSVFCKSVIGFATHSREQTYFDSVYDIDNIDDVIKLCDVVIICLPLTDMTRGLFQKTLFNKMKKGTVLVNVSRGEIICENDLYEAINDNIIDYAILDVQNNEPLSSKSWMWDNERVRITPHNAFESINNKSRINNMIYKSIIDMQLNFER